MNCLENLQWSELSDDYVPIKLVHFPSVIRLNNKSLLQFNFEKYKSILLSVFSLFLEVVDFFFLPLSIKQSGVWSALMSSTDCPAWFGNQRWGCLLFHFFCKHRTSLEKNKENKKKNWIIREIAYLKSEEFGKILCLSPCGPELTSATKVFWLIYLTLLPFCTLLRIQKENFYEFSKYWC